MAGKKAAEKAKDGRQHILDAAMDYCATYGLEPISVRAIANHAQVNSAMLRYYFGSKDQLLEALISSVTETIGNHRLANLKQLMENHPDGVPLDMLVRAYAEPFLTKDHPLTRDVSVHYRLLGRLFGEPNDAMSEFAIKRVFEPQHTFVQQFSRSAPHVSPEIIAMRFGMMVGALTVVGARADMLHGLSSGDAPPMAEADYLDIFARDWAAMFAMP